MPDTKNTAAFFKVQETAEVVMLAPETTLEKAHLIMEKALGRPINFIKFYSSHLGFSWERIRERFLKACQGAKVVILNDWIQADGLEESYQLAEKIANEVKVVNPRAKIFAFPMGGAWPAKVHAIAGIIFSFSDPALINALQA